MTLTAWIALAVIIVTVWALIKRYETRLVLIGAGLLLCCISLDPMAALNQFAKSMTNNSLVMAICSSMGFAFAASYTKCDRSLVHYLAAPVRGLGIFLIPVCTVITFFVNIAIPSAAGCAAAVGSTLIPVMLRAGIKPAAAAAAVLAGTIGSYLSPGTSHNPYVAKMANMEVMDFIGFHSTYSLMCGAILVVGVLLVCLVLRDNKGDANAQVDESKLQKQDDFTPSVLKALVMLVPIAILVCGNLWVPAIKMGVAQAMVIGAICALAVGRCNPQEFSKQFFNGMGKGYGNILGIIIAAGVFAAGLKAAGLVDLLVSALTSANEWARIGGAVGPYVMGVLTGSGDAAAFAFNEAVTPHAPEFGMTIPSLGYVAVVCGSFGRLSSPLCGGLILVAGIAGVNPIDIVKRSAPVMLVMLIAAYFVI